MNKINNSALEIADWFSYVDENIDLWITDPPYPFDNKNGSVRFGYKDGKDSMYPRLTWSDMDDFCKSSYDMSNDGARFYIFCNRDGLRNMWSSIEKAGWRFRNMLVWDKKIIGMGYHWRNQSEYILYASKGKPKSYIKSRGNILSYRKPRGVGQSAKPYQIWSDILNVSLCEGDVCADPFAGSNPFLAAIESDDDLLDNISSVYLNSF